MLLAIIKNNAISREYSIYLNQMGCGVKSFIIFALSLSLLLFCGCRERRKTHRNTGNSENSNIRYEHSGGRDTHRHNGGIAILLPGAVIRHPPVN